MRTAKAIRNKTHGSTVAKHFTYKVLEQYANKSVHFSKKNNTQFQYY